jgi:phosphoribosylformylglycinamidine cyclo-ligase
MSDYRREVIDLGDKASAMLYEACKFTWPNRAGQYGEIRSGVDHFRGYRSWDLAPLLEVPEPEKIEFGQETDGIGTKVKVSQRTSTYSGSAFDLTAMAADDAAARGYEPVIMTTDLNVNRFTPENTKHMQQLGSGIVAACRRARIALFGGETAIIGELVGGFGDPSKELWFDWSGAVHAAGHKDRIIDGSEIRPGMSVVGFKELGFRSNGLTAVQEILSKDKDWHLADFHFDDIDSTLGEAVRQPSIIYTPALIDCIGGYDTRVEAQAHIAGAAHITGGGIWSKFGELLEVSGFGADIDNPYTPPQVIKLVQRLGQIADHDAYASWNMGQGMIVVTSEPEKVISVASKNDIEAQEIGFITKQSGIRLRSTGAMTPGQMLTSETT